MVEDEDEVEQEEYVTPEPGKLIEDFQIIGYSRGYPEFANIHAYAYEDLVQANAAFGVILADRRKAEAEAAIEAAAEAAKARVEAA